ncbi:MAG: hypothetical protein OHK0045_21880 [Raineya sp.]
MSDKFIGYLNRSAEQIEQDLAAKFAVYLPEITDLENDPLYIGMKIWAGIAENLHYYLDRKAQETFLSTCRRFESAIKIAEANDYRVKGSFPASAEITFFFDTPANQDVIIPKDTIVATKDGIVFLTSSNVTILNGESEATVSAIQYEKFENIELGITNGQASQKFNLPQKVVDFDIRLNIASNIYGQVPTFFYSSREDYHFVASIDANMQMQVTLGDGITGRIPPIGEIVYADYYLCEGLRGNVAANKITEIISSVSVPSGYILKCTNRNRASGGVDAEGLEDLRKRIPKSRYTLLRAVTKQDYIDLAELYPGVERAGLQINCQKVTLYIAPTGGGVASTALLNAVKDYFSDKKTIGHNLQVLAAGEIRIKIKVELQVLPNFVNASVANNCKNKLLEFGSARNQQIGGEIQIGDVYELLETTKGVRYSKIIYLTPIPYAKPLTNKVLSWQVNVLEESVVTISWKIIFISNTQFQLIRNNSFFGIYNVSETVSTQEVRLVINPSGYVSGDAWEFKTYKYNGSIILEEPSLPVFLEDDLEIIAKGGV